MNRTSAFQRPLLEMKLSFLMSSMSITSFMESRVYHVDQEHHGQTVAETAVRLFKKQWTLMAMSLEGDERFNGVTIRQAVKMTVWARNTQLTISGYSPLGDCYRKETS